MTRRAVVALVATALVACGSGTDRDGHGGADRGDDAVATRETATESAPPSEADCSGTADADHPDVIGAAVEPDGAGTFTVAATLCSAYDSAERYADAFRVVVPETDEVLGVRELAHPHADEQPFTRSLSGVTIPDAVTEVVVEGRDLANGWGGATVRVTVPADG